MTRWAIHVAVALYPRRWRERYGVELEQLALDARQDRHWVGIILDLARGAAYQQLRQVRLHPALMPAAITLAVAATLSARGLIVAGPPPPVLHPGLGEARPFHSAGVSPAGRAPRAELRITVDPVTGAVMSAHGAPATLLINPITGELIQVTRRAGS